MILTGYDPPAGRPGQLVGLSSLQLYEGKPLPGRRPESSGTVNSSGPGERKGRSMIEIDGEVPELEGQACEGLWCQQFWHRGEVADEADVVLIKLAGRWHELYFDGGVVHWREREGEPAGDEGSPPRVFSYPLVDLAKRYGLKGCRIASCGLHETPAGETLTLVFEAGGRLSFANQGDGTGIRYEET
jgi:hypothetical protein